MRPGWVGYHSNMSSKLDIPNAPAGGRSADSLAASTPLASTPVDTMSVHTVPVADTATNGVDGAVNTTGATGSGAEAALIGRLGAAINALDDVDFALWSDAALRGHLDEVSLVLCRVDAQLSRLADAVRSRGFAITEADLPLAS